MLNSLKNHVERAARPIVRPIQKMGREIENELRGAFEDEDEDVTVTCDDIIKAIDEALGKLKDSIKASLRSIFSRQDNHRPNISNR